MDSFNIEACRSCKHAIIWAETIAGKQMPVDAAPTATGTIQLSKEDGVVRARVVRCQLPPDCEVHQDLRTSHFATCKQADSWRR
jgi:hypothetical protein